LTVLWLGLLITAAVIAAVAALTGVKPSGTRAVARTGLMAAARLALAVIVGLVFYALWRR
jgi:spore maturation protein SpmA